eukprot:TRINITY_DN2843_c1_g1_i3.p1 TRINITY_DN2843_c1_g1~~TRINITY_DN2843_c1_g1_i3.p1  ORF type:complete len:316 (-),score=43.06 TRINITY_DN2843_c1_g1_i3:352-1299(-)
MPVDDLVAEISAALRIIENTDDLPENIPMSDYAEGARSSLEKLCNLLGPFPFHFTCAGRINIMVQHCYNPNVDYNSFAVARSGSEVNAENELHINVCEEFVAQNTPKELTLEIFRNIIGLIHVGFKGIGYGTAEVHNEGLIGFVESFILGNPFGSLTNFNSWPSLNSRNIFTADFQPYDRVIHSYLFALLAQIVGNEHLTALLLMGHTFEADPAALLFGIDFYEVFLQEADEENWQIPVEVEDRFAQVIGKFWTAVFASCSSEPPTDPTFDLFADKPRTWLWDCSAFNTIFATQKSFTETPITSSLRYGVHRKCG